jgi:hypothetical protein
MEYRLAGLIGEYGADAGDLVDVLYSVKHRDDWDCIAVLGTDDETAGACASDKYAHPSFHAIL